VLGRPGPALGLHDLQQEPHEQDRAREQPAPPEQLDDPADDPRTQDAELATVGQVTGLGRSERIHAVRFLGAVPRRPRFVGTYREVEPLYVVDLADAAEPRVVGEFEVQGWCQRVAFGAEREAMATRFGGACSLGDMAPSRGRTPPSHRGGGDVT
jgi:hypothetical protein